VVVGIGVAGCAGEVVVGVDGAGMGETEGASVVPNEGGDGDVCVCGEGTGGTVGGGVGVCGETGCAGVDIEGVSAAGVDVGNDDTGLDVCAGGVAMPRLGVNGFFGIYILYTNDPAAHAGDTNGVLPIAATCETPGGFLAGFTASSAGSFTYFLFGCSGKRDCVCVDWLGAIVTLAGGRCPGRPTCEAVRARDGGIVGILVTGWRGCVGVPWGCTTLGCTACRCGRVEGVIVLGGIYPI
jgi:hypothetical protein